MKDRDYLVIVLTAFLCFIALSILLGVYVKSVIDVLL